MCGCVNDVLKSIYYAVKSEPLHPGMRLRLGYVFHTEAIQDPKYWPLLLRFCSDYKNVTGVEPVCTIMTPENARINQQMREFGVTDEEYVARVRKLESVAIIGHHGHYYQDPANHTAAEGEIRGDNYHREPLTDQFGNDLSWFRNNGVDHNGLYSGGWWFMHPDLVVLLIKEDYRVDFTFTYSPVFGHAWSKKLMREGGIRFGEVFRVEKDGGSIATVQDLIGCHNTPFVQDFSRHMNRLFNPDWPEVTGVVNSHDFNLDRNYEFTFKVLRFLATQPQVSFWGREDLDEMAASRLRVIPL